LKNDYVAAYLAMTDNTGVDTVTVVGIRYEPRYAHDDATSTVNATAG
jgi:hypothetical protein